MDRLPFLSSTTSLRSPMRSDAHALSSLRVRRDEFPRPVGRSTVFCVAALDNNYKNKMVRRRGHNKNKASKETKRDNTVAGYSWRSKMNLITLITVLGLCIFYSSGKD